MTILSDLKMHPDQLTIIRKSAIVRFSIKMGLEKAIASGKEHRKPYSYCKSVDKQCRNHGECSYCKGNRLYKNLKRLEKSKYVEE